MNTAIKNATISPATGPCVVPRVLLVEDDPTSRAYLSTVVRGVPAEVDCADSLAAARVLADAQAYDLWLFDAQLPDGSGRELLATLQSRHPGVPALAHTASTEPALWAALIASGFSEVLVKPLSAAHLLSAVRRALGLCDAPTAASHATPGSDAHELPLWDDEAAARALNFNRTHIAALRGMFLAELPQARVLIAAAVRDGDAIRVRADLHKLRASCGFVGAARLAAAVDALQRQPGDARLAMRFERVAHATAAVASLPTQSGAGDPGSSAD